MTTPTDLCKLLGISHPIIQAPMAGGTTTVELVAAVSGAGALGSLGAAYLTPAQLREAVREIRSRTDRPFNVNLFVGGREGAAGHDPSGMMAILARYHAELGLPAPAPRPRTATASSRCSAVGMAGSPPPGRGGRA